MLEKKIRQPLFSTNSKPNNSKKYNTKRKIGIQRNTSANNRCKINFNHLLTRLFTPLPDQAQYRFFFLVHAHLKARMLSHTCFFIQFFFTFISIIHTALFVKSFLHQNFFYNIWENGKKKKSFFCFFILASEISFLIVSPYGPFYILQLIYSFRVIGDGA